MNAPFIGMRGWNMPPPLMPGFTVMKLRVTVSQIVSAPREADIKQLSHPRQQMRVYNCTRRRNNRDGACNKTTAHAHTKVLLFWQGTGATWELELSEPRVAQGGWAAAARASCDRCHFHITTCVVIWNLVIRWQEHPDLHSHCSLGKFIVFIQ